MNHVRTITSRPAGWRLLSLTAAALSLGIVNAAQAQAAAPAKPDAAKEVVELPTFTINETPVNPYVSKQAW